MYGQRQHYGDSFGVVSKCKWVYLLHKWRHKHRVNRECISFAYRFTAAKHDEIIFSQPSPCGWHLIINFYNHQPKPERPADRFDVYGYLPNISGSHNCGCTAASDQYLWWHFTG